MVMQTSDQWKTLCVESPPLKMILKALFYPKISVSHSHHSYSTIELQKN